MIDTKKLIAGFLVLSVLMGLVSVLILPNLFGSPTPPTAKNDVAVADPATGDAANTAPQTTGNAFTEPIPNIPSQTADVATATDNSQDTAPPTNTPTNLTEGVGQVLLAELDAANPNGPQDDGTGQTSLVAPDPNTIADHFAQISAFQSVSAPDWEADALAETFPTVDTTSTTDLTEYAQSMKSMLDTYFVKSGLQNMTDPPTLEALAGPAKTLSAAVDALKAIPVPTVLAGFHRDLLKVVVYDRNAMDLVRNAGDDPMRAALIMQSQQAHFAAAMNNFKDDIEKAKARMMSSEDPEKGTDVFAIVGSIFGVKTAHAQWVVFDPLTETMTTITTVNQVIQFLWHILQSVLLQLLKNALVQLEQGGLKNWILGRGKPLFITNWKSMLKSIYSQTAGYAISQITPQLCTSFGAGMRTSINQRLNRIYSTNNGPQLTACTLDRVIANFKNFQSRFVNGGWQAFAATLLPSGNYFGTMYESQALIAHQAQFAKDTHTSQSVAGAGYKGTGQCADGSNPNGTYTLCVRPDGSNYAMVIGACNVGDQALPNQPNNGLCTNRSTPQVTTPGKTAEALTQNTFSAKLHNIVNANDIIGLVVQAAQAILSRVFGSGAGGLFGM